MKTTLRYILQSLRNEVDENAKAILDATLVNEEGLDQEIEVSEIPTRETLLDHAEAISEQIENEDTYNQFIYLVRRVL
jgi:hypothetical protein